MLDNYLEKAKRLWRLPVTGSGRWAVVTEYSVKLCETYAEADRSIVSPKHCRLVDLKNLPTVDEAISSMKDRYPD